LSGHPAGSVLEPTADRRSSMRLAVLDRIAVANEVVLLRLGDPQGAPLPPWRPGAHLELVLPSGLVRHYSLCGDPDDPAGYTVAVLRVAAGDGGSRELHDSDLVGMQLEVRGPRNNFALDPAAGYLFIAGGIGITPISAMVREVAGSGQPWRLIYGGRSRTSMAFRAELCALAPDSVLVAPQDEVGLPDLAGELAAAGAGTAVYACGPPAMLAVITQLCAERPELTLRLERFTADGAAAAVSGAAFEVELRRTGVVLPVPADRTLLDVVRDVVRTQPYSCAEGICGTCETDVLEGIPEHHDDVLSDEEKASNQTMMLCVSRSKSPRLVLDL
jgi:ferredoxin-NADP reductase